MDRRVKPAGDGLSAGTSAARTDERGKGVNVIALWRVCCRRKRRMYGKCALKGEVASPITRPDVKFRPAGFSL
jgi:hypothetical protein